MAMPPSKSKKRRTVFSLNAPEAIQVSLAGDFNNWNKTAHPMKKNKTGIWEKILMLDAGRYEYKFFVDGQWKIDPDNSLTSMNCFGTINNVLMVIHT